MAKSIWLISLVFTFAGCDENQGGTASGSPKDAIVIDAVVDEEVDSTLPDVASDAQADASVDAGPDAAVSASQKDFLGRNALSSLGCQGGIDPGTGEYPICAPGLAVVPRDDQVGYAVPAADQGITRFYQQGGAGVEQAPTEIFDECEESFSVDWGTYNEVRQVGNYSGDSAWFPDCDSFFTADPQGQAGTPGYRQQPAFVDWLVEYTPERQTEENVRKFRQDAREANECLPNDQSERCNTVRCVFRGQAVSALLHPAFPFSEELNANGIPINEFAHPGAECGAYAYDMEVVGGKCLSGVMIIMECFRLGSQQKSSRWTERAERSRAAWNALASVPPEEIQAIAIAEDGTWQITTPFAVPDPAGGPYFSRNPLDN